MALSPVNLIDFAKFPPYLFLVGHHVISKESKASELKGKKHQCITKPFVFASRRFQ